VKEELFSKDDCAAKSVVAEFHSRVGEKLGGGDLELKVFCTSAFGCRESNGGEYISSERKRKKRTLGRRERKKGKTEKLGLGGAVGTVYTYIEGGMKFPVGGKVFKGCFCEEKKRRECWGQKGRVSLDGGREKLLAIKRGVV